jgi:hypothetical protein
MSEEESDAIDEANERRRAEQRNHEAEYARDHPHWRSYLWAPPEPRLAAEEIPRGQFPDEDSGFSGDVAKAARGRRIAEAADEHNKRRKGNASVFREVVWSEVRPKEKVPLDPFDVLLVAYIHWISGAAGSGKTIFAYWLLVQYAKQRTHSAIYECEMGKELALGLLRNLGATGTDLEYIHYYEADEEGTVINLVRNGRAFCEERWAQGIRILLYDALSPLITAAELNENLASDVRLWVTRACYPVSSRGGLVIVIDHTGKANPDISRGSSDKPAAGHVDIVLRQSSVFARGIPGAIELTCNKDRTGTMVKGSKLDVKVEPGPTEGSIRLIPDMWDWRLNGEDQSDPTQAKIAEKMRDFARPVSVRSLAAETGLEYEAVRSALRRGATGPGPKFIKVGRMWELKPVGDRSG